MSLQPISTASLDTLYDLFDNEPKIYDNVHSRMHEWIRDLLNDDEELNGSGVSFELTESGVSTNVSIHDIDDLSNFKYSEIIPESVKEQISKLEDIVKYEKENMIEDARDEWLDDPSNNINYFKEYNVDTSYVDDNHKDDFNDIKEQIEQGVSGYAENLYEAGAGYYSMACEVKNKFEDFDAFMFDPETGRIVDVPDLLAIPKEEMTPEQIKNIADIARATRTKETIDAIIEKGFAEIPEVAQALADNHNKEAVSFSPLEYEPIVNPEILKAYIKEDNKELTSTQEKFMKNIKHKLDNDVSVNKEMDL